MEISECGFFDFNILSEQFLFVRNWVESSKSCIIGCITTVQPVLNEILQKHRHFELIHYFDIKIKFLIKKNKI